MPSLRVWVRQGVRLILRTVEHAVILHWRTRVTETAGAVPGEDDLLDHETNHQGCGVHPVMWASKNPRENARVTSAIAGGGYISRKQGITLAHIEGL